mgnify:CR=1 FL=1
MIENLICIKENDLLQWACGESNILVSMPFLDYALVDSTRPLSSTNRSIFSRYLHKASLNLANKQKNKTP